MVETESICSRIHIWRSITIVGMKIEIHHFCQMIISRHFHELLVNQSNASNTDLLSIEDSQSLKLV